MNLIYDPTDRHLLATARDFGPALAAVVFGGASRFMLVYLLAPVTGALLTGSRYQLLVLASDGATLHACALVNELVGLREPA